MKKLIREKGKVEKRETKKSRKRCSWQKIISSESRLLYVVCVFVCSPHYSTLITFLEILFNRSWSQLRNPFSEKTRIPTAGYWFTLAEDA